MDTMSWLQTREASTLVIVTFLASSSLLLLTVEFRNENDPDDHKLLFSDIAVIGFSFAILGLAYRQVTAWTADRKEHNRDYERSNYFERIEKRGRRSEYYSYAGFREFLVLFFLSIPVTLWLPSAYKLPINLCDPALSIIGYVTIHIGFVPAPSIASCTILFSGMIAIILTLIDLALRRYDKHHH